MEQNEFDSDAWGPPRKILKEAQTEFNWLDLKPGEEGFEVAQQNLKENPPNEFEESILIEKFLVRPSIDDLVSFDGENWRNHFYVQLCQRS